MTILNNAAFWLSLSAAVFAACIAGIRICSKSACVEFNCMWGCLSIKRNVEVEAAEQLAELEMGRRPPLDMTAEL